MLDLVESCRQPRKLWRWQGHEKTYLGGQRSIKILEELEEVPVSVHTWRTLLAM